MPARALIGFAIGTMIGMTGIGGGVLLLPVLIFGLHVQPIVAVGSDMVCNAVTKIGAGYLHWRRGAVNWAIVGGLACGSVPGVILGTSLLQHLRNIYGSGVNHILTEMIGILLLCVPVLVMLQGKLQARAAGQEHSSDCSVRVVFIGFIAGVLVGMTSVGSGSIIMFLLLLFFPFSPGQMVGTDILHAVLLTGVASFLHLHMGTVDLRLALSLLVGAIPGGLLGAELTNYIPAQWLRRLLCGALVLTGARMLA
ncbi:MAG: hypothetical protein JWO91_3333 [Acidobacteriaceae bacterium]|nr:hypothetical protein [Acidobacteriaceae bacterium]